uniref:Uncharacterized protein n=1 Tax=Anopheles coluzzii TaxID=1518534 RepID=A0A8W7PGG3_ANOCL
MSADTSTVSGQWTVQACRNTSVADWNFFLGHPRQSHTHGQLGSTSSSTIFCGSIAGIIWMEVDVPPLAVATDTGIVIVFAIGGGGGGGCGGGCAVTLLRWSLEADRIALCVCGDVDRFLFDDGATTTNGTTATARCNHRGTGAAARHHRRSAGCDDRGTTGHRRPRVAYDHLARELRHQYLLALLVEENLLRRLPTLIRAHRALHRHLRKGRGGCLLLRRLLLLHDDDRLLPGATVLLALGEQYRLLQLGLRLRLLGHHVRLSLRVGGKDVLRRLRMLRGSQYGGLHERSARRCRRLL